MLEGLAKARHPVAKAAAQAPAKQGVAKKRSCTAGKPMCMRASEGENASLRRDASILTSLRNDPTKKQCPAEEPHALPLRPIPACKRCSKAARARSPARHRRLKSIAGFSSRRRHSTEEPFGSASRLQQLRPVPPYLASARATCEQLCIRATNT